MQRVVLAALPLVLAAAVACSPAEPGPTASTSPTPAASPSESSGTGVAEAYCTAVDDFIAATRAAMKDPLKADPKALQQQSQELREQAEALPGQLIDDPEAITAVQACTQKLQQFNASQ